MRNCESAVCGARHVARDDFACEQSLMADCIAIEGLQVECIIGLYDEERRAVQPVCVDLEMQLDTEPAARGGRLSDTVDYAAVSQQVRFLLQSCHFRLLETAAHVLARCLLLPPLAEEQRAAVQLLKLSLVKPLGLKSSHLTIGTGVPSLSIERPAGWWQAETRLEASGRVDIVYDSRELQVCRLRGLPGRDRPAIDALPGSGEGTEYLWLSDSGQPGSGGGLLRVDRRNARAWDDAYPATKVAPLGS